ncbi:DEAD/DEAH box helicase [Psychroflexus montanilacus]|uniref:DEAD/DEAH box helicase n=1 Tax=Psychroflexus montanilacus TaxID=2873598 RepID=UPI001CCC2D9D|nr:DEAD/DEAH box helicase [Psychroflexus montanilacus]MBZ9650654.1 DEAD/DEAH box helicase [Psychroflexus montanilacus]
MTTFESLGLSPEILRAIQDLGFESPSEVQAQTIPVLLEEPTDMVALAQTGTGKTAAFGFPLIQNIDLNSKKTQGLILSPTRELCMQITNELKQYAKYYQNLNTVAVYGGASITDQAKQIKRGAQIIVATPGRMKDMIQRNIIDISNINICILDEADEMLNMGFFEDIKEILSHSSDQKNTWLFSATMPKEVSMIAKKFMKTPKEITVGQKNISTKSVSHEYFIVGGRDRYSAVKRVVDANPDIYAVIFCRTKRDTQKVAEKLIEDGYSASALHGDLSQAQRDMVMNSFRKKQIQMLVATDVAARGIDVDDITHVINYQLPDEIETYTHRSGRTGRAGKEGKSLVIVTKSEVRKIRQVEKIIGQKFTQEELPSGEEICKRQLFHLADEIKNTEINHEIDSFIPDLEAQFEDLSKEDIIKKFFSVEFTRFHNYYKNAPKIVQHSADEAYSSGKDYGDETRFFINIGEKDGFNWMSMKDFLKEQLNLDRDGVAKVDVKNTFSFFNVATDDVEKVQSTFDTFMLKGRHVNVEITKDQKSGGGRKGGGGGRDRGDRKPRKRFDKNKSSDFKGKKSGGSSVKSSFERRRKKS